MFRSRRKTEHLAAPSDIFIVACANRKCGSGEGFNAFFEQVDFCENHKKSQNMHQACTRGTFAFCTKVEESRMHCLVSVSSTFFKNGHGMLTRE